MKYITKNVNYWKSTLVEGFKEMYERHEVNMSTIFELMAYVFIEMLVTPLCLLNIVIRGIAWTIEDHLGKPKTVEVEVESEDYEIRVVAP